MARLHPHECLYRTASPAAVPHSSAGLEKNLGSGKKILLADRAGKEFKKIIKVFTELFQNP